MPESVYPYEMQYPDDNDLIGDFPALLQGNLFNEVPKLVGSFDTLAAAQAELGASTSSPMLFTTGNPTTLWCLDSSGPHAIWTLGGGYTSGSFALADDQGNPISLGASQRYLNYRVEGPHCYGWAELVIGSSLAWPAFGAYFRFPLPFAAQNRTLTQTTAGECMVTVGGKHYPGVVALGSGSSSCILYINDMSRTTAAGLLPVSPSTGSGTTTTRAFTPGDIIRYSFDYERQV